MFLSVDFYQFFINNPRVFISASPLFIINLDDFTIDIQNGYREIRVFKTADETGNFFEYLVKAIKAF